MIKNKITLLNIISSLLLQIVSIISSFIVPRIILMCFGSSINGLVGSISQFLSYIALVEGGITGVIAANLYKPLVSNDKEKLNSILVTAQSFYRKIALVFIIYSFGIAFIYPVIVKTGYDYWYVAILTIVLSFGLLLEYAFSLTLTTLLNADKKVYIISFTKIILTIGNIALIYLITKIYPDIIVLKLASSLLFVLQPVIYILYVKHHYQINWKTPKDNNLIKERWNGFAINLAAFIHSSTDITIITFFCDLKTVSVYSIYFLIVSKMEVIIRSVVAGIEPTIGQAYAKNNLEELNQKMDLFEYIVFILEGLLFSITGMLLTPFVMLYTKGISDADYYQPLLGALLLIAEALYLVRYPHVSLSYSANKFKEITKPAYIEAGINIAVSLVLVHFLGVAGVAIGTIAGMLYRNIFQIYFTTELIPDRKQIIFYKKFFLMILVSLLGIFVSNKIFPFVNFTIKAWILHGIVYFVIFGLLYCLISLIFFRKELKYFKDYLKKR